MGGGRGQKRVNFRRLSVLNAYKTRNFPNGPLAWFSHGPSRSLLGAETGDAPDAGSSGLLLMLGLLGA